MIASFSHGSSQKSRGTQLLCSLTHPYRCRQSLNIGMPSNIINAFAEIGPARSRRRIAQRQNSFRHSERNGEFLFGFAVAHRQTEDMASSGEQLSQNL
jgi:hypothetical protein